MRARRRLLGDHTQLSTAALRPTETSHDHPNVGAHEGLSTKDC